jgi:hypothetical protein
LEGRGRQLAAQLRRGGLPSRLAAALCAEAQVDGERRVAELNKGERLRLLRLLTAFPLQCTGTEGYAKVGSGFGGGGLVELPPGVAVGHCNACTSLIGWCSSRFPVCKSPGACGRERVSQQPLLITSSISDALVGGSVRGRDRSTSWRGSVCTALLAAFTMHDVQPVRSLKRALWNPSGLLQLSVAPSKPQWAHPSRLEFGRAVPPVR